MHEPGNPVHVGKFKTGLIPTPRHRLAAARPHIMHRLAPAQIAYIPKKLDMWGNDQYGDCVTAEEAFAKACYSPEIFIDAATVVAWAAKNGFRDGANLPPVMDQMKIAGFTVGNQQYDDGGYATVDYSNEVVLQSALAQGPVKIGIDSSALPSGAGNNQGWTATGGSPGQFSNEDHCFTGDTRISLLDGRELSFAELANGAAGDSFWVYSCDENGNVVAGKAHSVRKTRESAELVKVTLDNGESVRCTANHRFLMRDGTYKEANDLQVDDSLMPLYRRVSPGGYELCYMPRLKGKKAWHPTHRFVAFGPTCRSNGMHAHHVNLDKRDNSPENLHVMTPEEHTVLHGHLSEYNRTPKHRSKARELMQALWNDPVWAAKQRAKLKNSASARGKRTGELGKSGFHTMDPEIRRRNGLAARGRRRSAESLAKGSETIRKRIAEDPEFREKLRLLALNASRAAALKTVTEKQRDARRENACKLNARKQSACANNHKVVSVELCGREDVYDLTVDNYHNFALSAGVFVHNCVALAGFGPAAWLFQQLGVPLPSGLPAAGYLLYTWSTIGFVDHAWIMSTCGEAWVRNPTTVGVPPLGPPPPPLPPPGVLDSVNLGDMLKSGVTYSIPGVGNLTPANDVQPGSYPFTVVTPSGPGFLPPADETALEMALTSNMGTLQALQAQQLQLQQILNDNKSRRGK